MGGSELTQARLILGSSLSCKIQQPDCRFYHAFLVLWDLSLESVLLYHLRDISMTILPISVTAIVSSMQIDGLVRKLLKARAIYLCKETIMFNPSLTKALFVAVGENKSKTTENWRLILSRHHSSLAGLSSEEISAVLALFIYSRVHNRSTRPVIRA